MSSAQPDPGDIEETADWNWKMIAALVVVALALIFILQNTERNSIRFLFFEWNVGTWVALLVTFVFGMIAGWLLSRFVRSRRRSGADEK